MPSELQHYYLIIPLFLAIAIGWWLGRRERAGLQARPPANLSQEYFTGLDFLLNEKVDEAIESFIRALEINSDTIPAHLALAKLFRRKGDVERAIRIHQNLLARPDLTRDDFLRVQMALARDYYAVGLLDRAENLLLEIIRQKPPVRTCFNARALLIQLYEKLGDWQQALDVGEQLEAEEQQELATELTHYSCELAEQAFQQGDDRLARSYLKQAGRYDDSQVRIYLLKARIGYRQGRWRQAIRNFHKVHDRDALFIRETLTELQQCYDALGHPDDCIKYLRSCMANAPSTSVMLAVAEHIRIQRGSYVAGCYITEELKKRPSVKGFNRLMDLHMHDEVLSDKTDLQDRLRILRGLTGQLEMSKPVYRCNHCGFSSRQLNWHCPSCKKWGSTRPIQGLEGE
ncbi:MAG: lipopolysaccharide assembly protein LapB [Marinobacterium sp.]|nr:lipopolysaccharide assembly protein LapB [Marinobacterium sp.]